MLACREIAAPERPCEARIRPPRRRAWLRNDMVSNTNRVSTFGKRKPLHAISWLPARGLVTRGVDRGGHASARPPAANWNPPLQVAVQRTYLSYPAAMIGSQRRAGWVAKNRHLRRSVEVHFQACVRRSKGCQGKQSADALASSRSRHSSRRSGKPATGRRAAVCRDSCAPVAEC